MSESIGVLFDRGDLGVLVPLGGMIRHPDNSDRLRATELVAGTHDPFVDLLIGGYVTARKFVLKESNKFHRGITATTGTCSILIYKNGITVGVLNITGSNLEVDLGVSSEAVFNFNDVLQLKLSNMNSYCSFIHVTLIGEFYPYNLSDVSV